MNANNSFKQIAHEDEQIFVPPPEIETNIYGSLQVLSIMGKAMDLYIPKVLEMFVLTLGGALNRLDADPTDKQPPAAPPNDFPPDAVTY